MDISKLNTSAREDEGTWIHIHDVDKEPQYFGPEEDRKPVRVKVAGSYSSRYRKAAQAQRDRALKQRRTQVTSEYLDRQQAELIAACIIEWDGFFNGDQPFPLSRENAVALLDAAPWIREQIAETIDDHSRFFANS